MVSMSVQRPWARDYGPEGLGASYMLCVTAAPSSFFSRLLPFFQPHMTAIAHFLPPFLLGTTSTVLSFGVGKYSHQGES
jgi:hypothetical protein